jgi:peptidoglycan/xylan/chitin deacetylase (PgdA/CDA1 family)
MRDLMEPHSADRSLKGKLRRRLARLRARRPLASAPERAMVSFSFDDAPASAALEGAARLQSWGLKGSYFISMGLAGRVGPMGPNADAGQLRELMARGHEIACHTYSHLDCGQASGEAAAADVERNRAALLELGAPAPMSFAYPYGDVSVPAKAALSARFALMRGLHHGLVRQGSDLNQAPAVGVEGPDGETIAHSWIKRAARERAWLILYTHDVAPEPSPWGCTPLALDRLIDAAHEHGLDIVTVADGCRRLGALG